MNSQQEYDEFMTKFWKNIDDIRREYEKLSTENKKHVSSVLQEYGLMAAVNILLQNVGGQYLYGK